MNIFRKMLTLSFSLWLSGWALASATAHEEISTSGCSDRPACSVAGCTDPGRCHHCAHCGCGAGCLVCRLVPDEKKMKVNCFAAECKPLCLPCPSQQGCRNAEYVDCSKNGCSCSKKKVVWFNWCAGDAQIHTPKHLMKKTTEKKVSSYKWVVENLCEKCQRECQHETVPAGANVPPPPTVAAKIIQGVPVVAHLSLSDY
jgi:hypothetical protein